MKKSLFIVLLLLFCCFLYTPDVKAATVDKDAYYTISCNPGEDASVSMRISWHTDVTKTDSYVLYTKKIDTSWNDATKVEGECELNEAFTSLNAIGSTFNQNGAVLENLTANTEYMYKITDGTTESEVRYFKTAGAEEYSFIWTSDFHAYSGGTRLNNATKAIDKAIELNGGTDFIFSTGDIVAHGGTYEWWKQIADASWMKNYMFATTLGNHDWMTKSGTTVALGASNIFQDACYNFPKNGYAGQENICYYFYYGDALFICLNTEEYTAAQYKWCEEVLKNANAQYIFLYQHYQAFNKAGGANSSGYTRWKNLCDEYGVDIFFSGNSHVYVRSKSLYQGAVSTDKSKGTVYMVAPSSDGDRGELFSGFSSNSDLLACGWANGTTTIACSIVNITSEYARIRLVNVDGTVIDNVSITPKRLPTERTTRDLSTFDKEEFETSLTLTNVPKDYTSPRLMHNENGNDAVRKITIVDEETKAEYYCGILNKNTKYTTLSGFPKKVMNLNIIIDYYDNTTKEIKLTFKNFPSWGRLDNLTATQVDNDVLITWDSNITKSRVNGIDVFVDDSLYKEIENDAKSVLVVDYAKDNHKIIVKIKDKDNDYVEEFTVNYQKPLGYKVTFMDGVDLLGEVDVLFGDKVSGITAPIKEGYRFIGWDKDLDTIEGECIVNAVYEKTYKITFIASDNVVISYDVASDEEIIYPTAPEKAGYRFIEWDNDSKLFTEDTNINAVYEKLYTVTFKDDAGNTLDTVEVISNEKINYPSDAKKEGYKFAGWDKEITTTEEDVVITATFVVESGCKNAGFAVLNVIAGLSLLFLVRRFKKS